MDRARVEKERKEMKREKGGEMEFKGISLRLRLGNLDAYTIHSLTGGDWIHFTHDVNDGSFTSDGTITLPMTKSFVEQVSSRPHLSSANEGLDCSVTLPDSPMMFQQTRSSRPVAKLKIFITHYCYFSYSLPYLHVIVFLKLCSAIRLSSRKCVLINSKKTASGHHPTGGVLEVDLSPHGSIRSAGTREYR